MSPVPGDSIGPYTVVGLLGSGGMGEVYRARDTKLDRDVAIKVLPEPLSGDPERLARFAREAKTLAALNHSNIAHVYGLEESGGVRAIVMELVEGPTLADRIEQGAIPIDETLAIARQIAAALDAAHLQGVIHRDLKPSNIKVRPDGTVKVLDFGLAKALDVSAGASADASVSHQPTITSPAMTLRGVLLGTPAYMSPEQARGKPVDRRADIWSFGAVLYEMMTGVRLFRADEVSDTLALVLTHEPDWQRLPSATPPSLQRLIRRCLQRDRSTRLSDIADARLELDDAATELRAPQSVPAAISAPRPAWQAALPWAVAVTAAAALAIALMMRAPAPSLEAVEPVRVGVDFGAGPNATTGLGSTMALSPDGTALAFVARAGRDLSTPTQIFLRKLDAPNAVPIAGTERASAPFFSPDGRWIAFISEAGIRKIPVDGGPVIPLASILTWRGGTWTDTDEIVYASLGFIHRVSAAGGGNPTPLTTRADGDGEHANPSVLPNSRALLYAVSSDQAQFNGASIMLKPLPDGQARVLIRNGYAPRYLASGHLLFVRDGAAMVAPFDVSRLEVTGEPVVAIEGVMTNPNTAATFLTASPAGTIAYVLGGSVAAEQTPMMWLDGSSSSATLRAATSAWALPRFSPDGTRVAMTISDGRQQDVWVYEWQRDILTRLTSDPGDDVKAVWSPDSRWIVYGSRRGGKVVNLFIQRADGTGVAERLTESDQPQLPGAWHPTANVLAFHEGDPTSGRQRIMTLRMEADGGRWKAGALTELLGGPFMKANPTFSRDGKWMAYEATDTGRFEAFVQPFPGPGDRVQISNSGVGLALWSPQKDELYFAQGLTMMVVPYTVIGSDLRPERPRPWSTAEFSQIPPLAMYGGSGFDLHPDGQRFVVAPVRVGAPTAPGQVMFLFNAFAEFRRIAPIEQ